MLSRWIEDLESADQKVRLRALQELSQLGPAARETVPTLIAALEKAKGDGTCPLRDALVDTLGAIGPDARAAVPRLVSLVDPNGAFMWDVAPAFAILRIGGEPFQERLAVAQPAGGAFPEIHRHG